MSFNYRFSVIPAGAITDARLTPRALQVLCLLGRHTNDAGWCSRSQVKMARELGCVRSTLYDAIELLLECGWIERRPNGRGGRAPVEGEQPFAAYSYRVLLDRDVLPERLKPVSPPPDDSPPPASDSEPDGGAAQAAGGADIAAGGADIAAPLEGIFSEGTYSEPERDTRAREKKATGLATFEARWPTAAADDRIKTTWAWEALTEAERDDALTYIGPFLQDLKRHKRSHPPAGWKYLEQKRWTLLAQKAAVAAVPAERVAVDGEAGKAWAAIHRVARMSEPLRVQGTYLLPRPLTAQELAMGQIPEPDRWIFVPLEQVNQCGAWNEFLGSALAGKPRRELIHDRNPGGSRGFMAPWPWPPRVDGSLCTGPPTQSQFSKSDAEALSK